MDNLEAEQEMNLVTNPSLTLAQNKISTIHARNEVNIKHYVQKKT